MHLRTILTKSLTSQKTKLHLQTGVMFCDLCRCCHSARGRHCCRVISSSAWLECQCFVDGCAKSWRLQHVTCQDCRLYQRSCRLSAAWVCLLCLSIHVVG